MRDDECMNMNPSPADIADAAMINYFNTITDRDDLLDYATELDDDMPALDDAMLRTALFNMIDLDFNDMIHNANFDFYAPLDELDALTDAEYDALTAILESRTDPELITDALMRRFA